MRNVLALILGGGKGTRLYPLTKYRSKPAVPLAAKYRIIDIPISNCLNCGLNRIYVLTQFNSASLNQHITHAYQFDWFGGGFVEILAAQQTQENNTWYQGTADAVRQNMRQILEQDAEYILILSGDQLYRMDFTDMLRTHQESRADVTIAALPVDRKAASAFGILRVDDSGRVVGFLEKPKTNAEIDMVRMEPAWIDAHGVQSKGRDCLASMGIYLFNRQTLIDSLTKTDYKDFGKEVFPASIRSKRVQVHLFDGYWEDIGTIRAFYDANLLLTSHNPPFSLASAHQPIFSRPRFLAPTRIDGATVRNSLIADGCRIDPGAVIEDSVIGLRCRIGSNVTIKKSVIMGADFFQTPAEREADVKAGRPIMGIGDNCYIDGAIVDKNARIGAGARVVNERGIVESPEFEEAMISDGILVVPKDATLPKGWRFPEL